MISCDRRKLSREKKKNDFLLCFSASFRSPDLQDRPPASKLCHMTSLLSNACSVRSKDSTSQILRLFHFPKYAIPSNYFLFPHLQTLKKGLSIHHCACKSDSVLNDKFPKECISKCCPQPMHGTSAPVWLIICQLLTSCGWKSVLRYFWPFFF